MSISSQQGQGSLGAGEMPEAERIIAQIERTQRGVLQHSMDNGIVLMVWGVTFFLDMLGFDLSLLTGSVLPGLISICCLNSAVVIWRLWYTRRLPIRLLNVRTNRIIFWWSFYYMVLVGLGVAGWIVVIGPWPPFWLSFIGILGALPLLISGRRQWLHAHQVQQIS